MKIFRKLTVALFFLFTSQTTWAEMPQISDARIVQPPPGSKVAAAYFKIANGSDEAIVITGASSNIDAMVEVHLSAVIDDVATMKKQEQVEIPAGESLEFKHGSYHIMFMSVKNPLVAGDVVNVSLETSAGLIPVEIPVITLDEASKRSMNQGDKKTSRHMHKHKHTMESN